MGLPEPSGSFESDLVLRGDLKDVDLEQLLSALRLGRQYLTLEVLDASGAHHGSVSVKAGHIVDASAGERVGSEAVRELLDSQEASEFRVWLQPSDAGLTVGDLGSIVDVTRFEDTEQTVGESREQVLQGALSEHLTLSDLLSVVAFTRQHVSLELHDRNGTLLGNVRAKSGKLLSARAGELSELAALQLLLRAAAGTTFELFTEHESVADLRPLGSVREVLSRAREHGAAAPAANGVRKTPPPPLPRPRQPQARILEGSLEEFELAHVLRVLSTSRQQFELHVRDDGSATVGVIEVKSGMVVAASTDTLEGVLAARELLAARSGRFVAIRRAEVSANRQPLISVHELLKPAETPATGPGFLDEHDERELDVPIPVLNGKLAEVDVASILHVAGASRQYTTVHIVGDQRQLLGTIHLKGSHIVSAQAQDVSGIAAVRRLLYAPRDCSFLVQRYPNAPELTTSLGSTSSVLQRAGAIDAAPAARVTQAAPARAAAPSGNWIAGALVGAGFVLLGGIGTAIVLRSPVLNASSTSTSPSTDPAPAARPAPLPLAAEPEPPRPAAVSSTPAEPVEAPAASGPPSRAAIASFQAGLRQLGYETGSVDGVIGPRTMAAIKAFQYAEHLTADGTLSAPTRAVLLRRIGEPGSP